MQTGSLLHKQMSERKITIKNTNENTFSVFRKSESIGTVELYENRFHAQHGYLRLRLTEYDGGIAAELFDLLSKEVGKPLQVMLPSDDTELTSFLKDGGFALKRRCFEVTAGREDLIETAPPMPSLAVCSRGDALYSECCALMYSYYKTTHEAISPLTAPPETFYSRLPDMALFIRLDGKIVHTVFTEENEIAFIASASAKELRPFCYAVVQRLFCGYERISFECDDCDAAAMTLRSLFRHNEASFDTYVR